MNHKVLLTIDISDEATQRQRKQFYEELIRKNYKEVNNPQSKWQTCFDYSLTEKTVIDTLKKEVETVTMQIGIKRYSVVAHFEESNLVIFFSGQNRA
ncbi:MAG: hypothetical protein Q8940_04625 [Bacteroidota bacterium]|nr:hypothetical protein [Bacteroidota bacterium]